MALYYHVEKKGKSLLVRVSDNQTKRVLYLDTIKKLAEKKDEEILKALYLIHRKKCTSNDTFTFERIEVPFSLKDEVFKLIEKTSRMVGRVDEEEEKRLTVSPRLVLKDPSGLFADLFMDYADEVIQISDFKPKIGNQERLFSKEKAFEEDLFASGFEKKQIGTSEYFCAPEKVKEALELLIEFGFEILDHRGEKISSEIDVTEKDQKIFIKASHKAFIDHKLHMLGNFQNGIFVIKKSQAACLNSLSGEKVNWDENIEKLVAGLALGSGFTKVFPGKNFQGKLLEYQQTGLDWLFFLAKWGFSAFLADEMGLGKTVQVLAFLSAYETNLPTLIVCPTSLKFNWQNEIGKFLTDSQGIELISYNELRMNIQELAAKRYGVIVLDESSMIKNPKTLSAEAAYQLKGDFRICLNGTPLENRYQEVYSQFQFLMPDLIENKPLKEQIKPFILRRKKEDVLKELPEKQEQITYVEMDEEQSQLYSSERNKVNEEGNPTHIFEMILRLRQIAIDPRLCGYDKQGSKLQKVISDALEIVESNSKVLIFSQFTSVLKLMIPFFPDCLYLDGSMSGEKRKQVVEAFQNDPEKRVFLSSLKAGGVGLNLTKADYVLMIDPWWNEALEAQAAARAHRIGRKTTVIIRKYLTAQSIEEKMLCLKTVKLQDSEHLLDFESGKFSKEELLQLLR